MSRCRQCSAGGPCLGCRPSPFPCCCPDGCLQGREDLRAEARLMQLLRACHAALQHPGAARDGALAVHCFEVTPLGARLGLVQVGGRVVGEQSRPCWVCMPALPSQAPRPALLAHPPSAARCPAVGGGHRAPVRALHCLAAGPGAAPAAAGLSSSRRRQPATCADAAAAAAAPSGAILRQAPGAAGLAAPASCLAWLCNQSLAASSCPVLPACWG